MKLLLNNLYLLPKINYINIRGTSLGVEGLQYLLHSLKEMRIKPRIFYTSILLYF